MLRHNREVVRCLLVALLMLAALPSPGRAVAPDEVLPDATMEARARALSQKLRCVVCQNQSIDDSTAPLARDLRILVRDRLKGGDSDADALKFIVARYGNFVLLQPPFQSNTLLLWLGPALLLILTAAGFASLFRRNGQDATEQQQKSMQFSTAEKKRLDAIFSEGRPT